MNLTFLAEGILILLKGGSLHAISYSIARFCGVSVVKGIKKTSLRQALPYHNIEKLDQFP
mgnify:CR=1 FL=1